MQAVKKVISPETALSQAKKAVNEVASAAADELADSLVATRTVEEAGENATSVVAKVILPGMLSAQP